MRGRPIRSYECATDAHGGLHIDHITSYLTGPNTYIQWPETYNLVFGRTVNPVNRTLTCGGSSGGEGALLGMRGSILGVGSDIGG
jgi:hypothetical protein